MKVLPPHHDNLRQEQRFYISWFGLVIQVGELEPNKKRTVKSKKRNYVQVKEITSMNDKNMRMHTCGGGFQ